MKRQQASKTFLRDENQLLWLGLLTRDTGIPSSQRLQIKDEVTALGFDLAVSLRLFQFDNEKDAANRKFWVKMVGGEVNDDVLDASVLNDPYADGNTQVW